MSEASLNDIYKQVGELIGTVKGLGGKVDDLKHELAEAEATSAAYRQGVRDELAKLVVRATHLESDMSTVKERVEAHEKVTVEVKTLRSKAEGAGTLGRWLIRVGIGVVTVAGWIIGAYTWLTGRPPP